MSGFSPEIFTLWYCWTWFKSDTVFFVKGNICIVCPGVFWQFCIFCIMRGSCFQKFCIFNIVDGSCFQISQKRIRVVSFSHRLTLISHEELQNVIFWREEKNGAQNFRFFGARSSNFCLKKCVDLFSPLPYT